MRISPQEKVYCPAQHVLSVLHSAVRRVRHTIALAGPHQSSAHTHQRPGRTQIPTARNLCWLAVPMLDGCSNRRLAARLQHSQELFCRCGENNSPNTMLLSEPLNKIDKHAHPLTAGSDHTSRPLPTPTPSTAARVQTAVQRCAAHLAPFTSWAHSHCTKTREGNKSREELNPHTLLVPW